MERQEYTKNSIVKAEALILHRKWFIINLIDRDKNVNCVHCVNLKGCKMMWDYFILILFIA